MRNLVQPPPSSHCELCHGELRLKLIEPNNSPFDLDIEIFVCAKCGHEQAHVVSHNHYAAHTAKKKKKMPAAKAGWPGGSCAT